MLFSLKLYYLFWIEINQRNKTTQMIWIEKEFMNFYRSQMWKNLKNEDFGFFLNEIIITYNL